jgi:hypothetical protein
MFLHHDIMMRTRTNDIIIRPFLRFHDWDFKWADSRSAKYDLSNGNDTAAAARQLGVEGHGRRPLRLPD